jgi:hypothetical protein
MSPTGLRRVALVTCRDALALDEDLAPLRDALAALGAEVALPCWDDASIDWARFDIAVLRSTWDYAERNDEFLDWAARCAAATRLVNPLDVLRWNTNKRYLADLARAGVPVVPTRFVAAGAEAAAELERFLAGGEESLSMRPTAQFRSTCRCTRASTWCEGPTARRWCSSSSSASPQFTSRTRRARRSGWPLPCWGAARPDLQPARAVAMDTDLDTMSREELIREVRRLRDGIRAHRDASGHDLCWHHPALWGLLPERTDPLPAVPSWPQFLRGCIRYRQSLDEQLPEAPRSDVPYGD